MGTMVTMSMRKQDHREHRVIVIFVLPGRRPVQPRNLYPNTTR
jgi:hypothetical protein